MYANVIVGADGKQGGRDAAALAASVTAPGALVSLVYVSTNVPLASNLDLELADDAALSGLLERERRLCGGDAEVRRLKAPNVGAGLEQAAEGRGADLIVVGASSRHGITRLLSGDDVKSVMHHTPRAVAVAPTGYSEHPQILSRIGVAFDGSPESEIALAHAGLLAAELHSALLLRHAVPPHFYGPGWGMVAAPVDDPRGAVAAARRSLGHPAGLEVDHVYGTAGATLAAFSRSVNLLACGSRRLGPARRIALGSTSDYLARHIRTPLLVTPPVDAAAVERWRVRRQAAAVG